MSASSGEEAQEPIDYQRSADPQGKPHAQLRRVVGQPRLTAREDRRRALSRNDHDADGHRNEHGGNGDVDEDQSEILGVPETGFADRRHGEEREHESLRSSEAEESGHRERSGWAHVAEAREDRTRTTPPRRRFEAVRCRAWSPTASRATPRRSVGTAFERLVRVEPVDGGLAEGQAEPHAITVPNTKPLRKAIPFVRGRSLRMTTNVAVSTRGLAAAARA